MTPYPTDQATLAAMTPDEWDALLDQLYANPPVPRRIIVFRETFKMMSKEARRERILEMLAQGMTGKAVAKELGVDPCLVSKVKNGLR